MDRSVLAYFAASLSVCNRAHKVSVPHAQTPQYEYCSGCDLALAQHCIRDMRANVSGNVRAGCAMGMVKSNYFAWDYSKIHTPKQPECCPEFEDEGSFGSLLPQTRAFNDALLCLTNVGCDGTQYYSAIEAECHANHCDVLEVRRDDDEFEGWKSNRSHPRQLHQQVLPGPM